MDENWGYPYFRKPPYQGYESIIFGDMIFDITDKYIDSGYHLLGILLLGFENMGGSINGGTPKWMVYNGTSF